MRVYTLGILFLYITNAFDVFYTHKVLSEGIAEEANPLINWVIMNYGFGGVASIKALAVTMIWGLLIAVHNKFGKIPDLIAALFWGSVFAYGILTAYHISMQVLL